VAVITWSPLLAGRLRAQALEAVQAIARSLSTSKFRPVEADRGSLVGGHAGLAVFFTYLKQAGLANRRSKLAERFLDEAADAVAETSLTPSLFEGFTGVAWATEHLAGRLFDPDEEDANEEIDEALLDYVTQSPWTDDYDLVGGLVGIGVYALERLPRPEAKRLLELVIERLAESAERGRQGVTWHTSPDLLPAWQRDLCPKGHYNLGLAHGVPGIVALLGQACAAGVARATAEPMLAESVAWLLAQGLPANMSSSFSSWAGPGVKRDSARSAWCYGDPGVAAALLVAARCVGEPNWEREALALARRAAS
jgi:lantibiotic modifying enzyme